MTQEPRTQTQIYNSMRASLSGKIAKLRNFTERSFNYVWTQAFSQEVQELEAKAVVAELSGWIDYAGKDLTEDDLEDLGIEGLVDPEQLNELMKDEYLDEYVKIVGVSRFEGTRAIGEVTIQTQSEGTNIPEGTVFTTDLDENGDVLKFETTEQAETADGVTSVQNVPIRALEIGTEYNVPSDSIIRMDNPPIGVKSVTNPDSTIGGEEEESNEDLRARAKQAVQTSSLGGTTDGIKGYLRQNVDGVGEGDVIIDEFTDVQPPFVDVIVDGGLDSTVSEAIEFSRPTGIRHNLIRPQIVQLGFNVDLLGQDIATPTVEDNITEFLLNLGISDNFYEDILIREIMQADDDILNIDNIGGFVERVTNETFTFDKDIGSAIADDGGTLSDETAGANDETADAITLLPSSPSVGDAYYFGAENVFGEIELNISTAGNGTWDIVWEYYNGSNWVSLSNVSDGTNDFRNANTNSVSWDVPSDWVATEVINNEGNYYIRARLDSFTSITTQPSGQRVSISQPSFRLNFTYENINGSITINDEEDNTYTKSSDFDVIDRSGDGWPETLLWTGTTPDRDVRFFVDYDVTVAGVTKNGDTYDTDEVRDEAFSFNLGQEDTFDYNNTQPAYEINHIPFSNSVNIEDENSTTFTEDTDWQLAPLQDYAKEDTFTYDDTQDDYTLSQPIDTDVVAIIDGDGNIFVRGTDYTVEDTDSDTFDETIRWDTNESTPTDGVEFTVNYDAFPKFIRWDNNDSTPPQDDSFTVTYDQVAYSTTYEIVETPLGNITDTNGTTYEEDVDYDVIDLDREGEDDAIYWNTNPSTLGNSEEFFFSYFTEADKFFGSREKADPGTISVEAHN